MRKLLIWIRRTVGTTQMARRLHRHLPSAKRCKECLVPFLGIFALPYQMLQIRPSRKNPHLCTL
ncbi:MAG: hypothetical protein ABIP88_11550 [Candidatus Binatia bacterium]|jgi:hypothetical protein